MAEPAGPDQRRVPHRLWLAAVCGGVFPRTGRAVPSRNQHGAVAVVPLYPGRRAGVVVRLPDTEASSSRMNALGQRIARLIEAQGPISIAQFMTIALHDPQSGYYAARDPFGAGGVFITAPEVSQMFGELLGLWIAQSWHDQGKPKARLVELGPGRGTLMSDALRVIKQLMPAFLSSVEIVLIEASPALTAIQKDTLKDSGASVRWAAQFDDALADKPLFLLA